MRYLIFWGTAILTVIATGCRNDEVVYIEEPKPIEPPSGAVCQVTGFYLLNEGNMGSNKCTLGYYDYATGKYDPNLYVASNPGVPMELGDVGNDIAIYGNRLYAVINCSNKVEVMDASNARRIGQVDIPNCRYIAFEGPFAYVTSYAGPVQIGPEHAQLGYVAKVDTAALEVMDRCIVGYQPDQIAIVNRKAYVANSGGYMVPNYENKVSVIDLASFTVVEEIEIAENLQNIIADTHGALWVSSRGDYYGNPARLFRYELATRRITNSYDLAASTLWLDSDSLYVVGTQFDYDTFEEKATYSIIDTSTAKVVCPRFVDSMVAKAIVKPYGVAVNPDNGDLLLTDAGNYVNPGWVYCINPDGTERWKFRAGEIPAHIVFTTEK